MITQVLISEIYPPDKLTEGGKTGFNATIASKLTMLSLRMVFRNTTVPDSLMKCYYCK